ncbi:MAG TPA: nucleoside phosphorylase, partial [Thermotoga sp.]|nr:nucleoside phosphorylase [Thermotoga sp.]
MSEIQKHIRCRKGDVGRYVLIPGDPGRARRIAERLESVKQIASNREFVVFTGKLDGITVSVC